MKKPLAPVLPLLLTFGAVPLHAADFTSTGSGLWHPSVPDNIWSLPGNPLPGASDNIIINGHTVIFANSSIAGATAGLPGSNDLGISGGNRIDINGGGVLSQQQTGWWTRIGHNGLGTLNINEGRFHFTDGTGGGSNLQLGVQDAGSEGRINIGGGAGPAVLNLRDRINGTETGGSNSMNLGASTNTSGIVTVNANGVIEGDSIVRTAPTTISQNPHIRVGQSSSTVQSVLRVNAGGQVNVRGNLEVGAGGGARGLVNLTGANARMDQYDGEFTVGFNGTGEMVVENGAVFTRHNTTDQRMDLYVGRAAGNGTITIRSGGQFIQGAGGNVGDMRIGWGGTGTLNVETGGTFRNDSGNWNWVGENTTGNGTINVRGGDFLVTTGSNVNVGKNGTGTFRQTSGNTEISGMILAENSGNATFDLQGGTFTTRGPFYMGGAGTASTGTGTATGTQTGGTFDARGAFVVGLAGGHTASYSLTGGVINHSNSDISVGESGNGNLLIGAGTIFNDTSNGAGSGKFFVGRNDGSSGTLTVNGTLTKTHDSEFIRVGNGNTEGVDNSTATGLLQGTGTITAEGVRIGTRGTITGGMNTTVGNLTINGNLAFSAGGTMLANFNSTGGVDSLTVNGSVDISGAVVNLGWLLGAPVGVDNPYWLIINDEDDSIVGQFANAIGVSPSSTLFPEAGGFVTTGGQEFALFYGADSVTGARTGGNDLMVIAIPEPTSAALLVAAGCFAGIRRRRR